MTPHERLSCRVTLRLTVLYINTGWDQTERHHSKKVLVGPIPFNYQVRHEFFSFFLPHFPGARRSERPLLPSEGILRLMQEVPLTDGERSVAEGDVTALNRYIENRKRAPPPPVPSELYIFNS